VIILLKSKPKMSDLAALRGTLALLRTFKGLARAFDPSDWDRYIPSTSNVSYESAIEYVELYIDDHSGGYGDNQ